MQITKEKRKELYEEIERIEQSHCNHCPDWIPPQRTNPNKACAGCPFYQEIRMIGETLSPTIMNIPRGRRGSYQPKRRYFREFPFNLTEYRDFMSNGGSRRSFGELHNMNFADITSAIKTLEGRERREKIRQSKAQKVSG